MLLCYSWPSLTCPFCPPPPSHCLSSTKHLAASVPWLFLGAKVSVRAVPADPLVNYCKYCRSLGRAEPFQDRQGLDCHPSAASSKVQIEGSNVRERPSCCFAPQSEQSLVFVSQFSLGKWLQSPSAAASPFRPRWDEDVEQLLSSPRAFGRDHTDQ